MTSALALEGSEKRMNKGSDHDDMYHLISAHGSYKVIICNPVSMRYSIGSLNLTLLPNLKVKLPGNYPQTISSPSGQKKPNSERKQVRVTKGRKTKKKAGGKE